MGEAYPLRYTEGLDGRRATHGKGVKGVFPGKETVLAVSGGRARRGDFIGIQRSTDCHFQESYDSLQLPYRSGLATRWNETYRSAALMLPCPRISPEVRPKSPYHSRLRPTPSFVPRVQDNIIILIRRNPRWVRRSMSVGCPTRRPSKS
jgi:hypothetical protein